MTFDIIVIGKGLIGSAAAKYLSRTHLKVAIIGPDEPENYNEGEVFASHYDSGRVFRQLGKNLAMTRVNLQAHKEYPILQVESGIKFHEENGCLYVNPDGRDNYLHTIEQRAGTHRVKAKLYDNGTTIQDDFPYLQFPEASNGMFESGPSGQINPKNLIKAQLNVVERNNGQVIREVVNRIAYNKASISVLTSAGGQYRCKKLILTMGAFSNEFGLLQRKLDLILKSETIILAQLSIAEKERLKALPSLLFELNTPEIEGIYATGPIQYPDGHYYLKIGANLPADTYFTGGLEEIKDWFVHGNSDAHLPVLEKNLRAIMPDIKIQKILSKRCILTRTNPHLENPYIGTLEKDRAYIAVGNGWSGANADGLGFIVHRLAMDGAFPEGFNKKDFAPVYTSLRE